MGRLTYVCTVCSEHFTRKYSAKRHNQNLHNGVGEIVRLIDYLAGRSSGQYMPDNPFWYKPTNPYHNIESTTVADNGWNSFQHRYGLEQAPVGISHINSIYQPRQIIDEQSYGTSISETTTTKLKIEELKRLVYKYAQYHNNDPEEIVRLVVYSCVNRDNTLLNNKLEQLRTIDRRLNGWA